MVNRFGISTSLLLGLVLTAGISGCGCSERQSIDFGSGTNEIYRESGSTVVAGGQSIVESGSAIAESGSAIRESGSIIGRYEAASTTGRREAGSTIRRRSDFPDPIREFRFDDAPDLDALVKPKKSNRNSKSPSKPARKRAVDDPDFDAPESKKQDAEQKKETATNNATIDAKLVAFRVEKDRAKLAPPGPASWASFRNGNRQLGVAGSKLPKKLELLWKVPAADGVLGGAAIVGNRVYVGILGGRLFCLDLKTGRQIWSYRSIDDPDPNAFAPGFKAAPRVTEETVYIGDEDGLFHAVDRATGKKKWIFRSLGEIAGCAAVVGDHVIIGSHDSYLYCLKAADGSVVWKFQTEDRVNCSPAISGKYTFVAGCDEHLRVIDIETGKQKSDIPLQTYLIASPAVMGDMLYVGTYASEVLAVDWKREQITWRYKDPKREFPYHASAAVTDKFVVVGGRDKQMHCIDRASGESVWTFPTRGRIDSSPVIVGNRVFFGSSDRNIYGLRLKDGKELWKYNTGGEVTASPAIGENHLVIGSEGGDGFIFCFGAK